MTEPKKGHVYFYNNAPKENGALFKICKDFKFDNNVKKEEDDINSTDTLILYEITDETSELPDLEKNFLSNLIIVTEREDLYNNLKSEFIKENNSKRNSRAIFCKLGENEKICTRDYDGDLKLDKTTFSDLLIKIINILINGIEESKYEYLKKQNNSHFYGLALLSFFTFDDQTQCYTFKSYNIINDSRYPEYMKVFKNDLGKYLRDINASLKLEELKEKLIKKNESHNSEKQKEKPMSFEEIDKRIIDHKLSNYELVEEDDKDILPFIHGIIHLKRKERNDVANNIKTHFENDSKLLLDDVDTNENVFYSFLIKIPELIFNYDLLKLLNKSDFKRLKLLLNANFTSFFSIVYKNIQEYQFIMGRKFYQSWLKDEEKKLDHFYSDLKSKNTHNIIDKLLKNYLQIMQIILIITYLHIHINDDEKVSYNKDKYLKILDNFIDYKNGIFKLIITKEQNKEFSQIPDLKDQLQEKLKELLSEISLSNKTDNFLPS
jgi:hypothetical protein